MPLTRRRLLAVAATLPVIVVAERAIRLAADGGRAAAAALRPAPSGTSATRCALCGSPDHTMLDSRCPAAKPVI